VSQLAQNVERKDNATPETILHKSRRPLKMPKNYDFSVRNVDWREYRKDFILRTDAVWEKSKLFDIFYTNYKVSAFHLFAIDSIPL
jgi:hypothetical protein